MPALTPAVLGPIAPLHGLGGAKDLPIPASLAITGGAAALVVSFCVLVLAWRTPRYVEGAPRVVGRPAPAPVARVVDSPAFAVALRALGLVFTAWVAWALIAGPDLVTNPIFGTFYVILWVGIVPASLLFGRFYRAVSPVRTLNLLIAKATGGDPAKGIYEYPAKLGYWPAAIGLFAFVWQELVNPQAAYLGPIRLWIVAYVAAMLIGAAIFGDTWISRADPFEAYSDLVAKLSVWARDKQGRLVLRSPLANLSTLKPQPGMVAAVAVLFGSTAFDSYKDTLRWVNFVAKIDLDTMVINTVALLVFSAAIGITFAVATMSTGINDSSPYANTRRVLPRLFAHSVVPIIVGYMTAHYLSYFWEQGQTTLLQLSDPMVDGSNYLGTANWSVNYWLSYNPTFLASLKVVAVVTGHVVGVIAAHDRAISLLPKKHHVTGQLGLLVIMVAYTATGLYLLFGAA